MITKIKMNGVTSYKNPATLETDKRVNLIYGLNGTGKTTLSNYLYNRSNADFSNCSIDGLDSENILVYNQQFVLDYFYESETLKGIFSLSKENKEASKNIGEAQSFINKLSEDKKPKADVIKKFNSELERKYQSTLNKIWEIKTTYAGGDRVLEYCISGLMGSKDSLFKFISTIQMPSQKPEESIDLLKKEVELLKGDNIQKFTPIPIIIFNGSDVEQNYIFQKEVIGNTNSTVAALITKLGNSDWVKKGLDYLPDDIDDKNGVCPFCQEQTITKNVISNIKNYFDETYENDIHEIQNMIANYEMAYRSIPTEQDYESSPFVNENASEFFSKYSKLLDVINENRRRIAEKIKNPSHKTILANSSDVIENCNHLIADINILIDEHNKKIDNKDASLNQIKKMFWILMRWDYDQTISSYQKESIRIKKEIASIENEISTLDKNIILKRNFINEQQRNTVNIDESISNINNELIALGIDGFHIIKHSDILYKIARDSYGAITFKTLCEGEKMIISFLYFCELCRGKKSITEIENKKIVVIDDPISSLSHIYVFNIGQLIKENFLKPGKYDQVFILTHSLYFFYELTDINHVRRKETQKLFRMIKNCNGSQILDMKYEEIQNDYHSYWQIVKDEQQPPAIIANCMRNIIEYFFSFVEKKDLNHVFLMPDLQQNKYQAFYRYINRESHSLGQNIFDLKEFDYNNFKEAFELVFKNSGYAMHYEEMIK